MRNSLFGVIIIAVVGSVIWRWCILQLEHPDNQTVFLDVPEVVQRHGYQAEEHRVVTADGYQLTVHRIPGKGRPVLLQHGYLQSSAVFVIRGPGHALGYLLADAGYDVWLGNSRGNYYSQKHVNSSISKHQFWDFSYHEMGVSDLPAVIDTVLNVTGRQQLDYIGFSMGTNIFFVMTSLLPDYNRKIAKMVALAPSVYLDNVSVTLMYYYFTGVHKFKWLLDAAAIYQLLPRCTLGGWLAILLCGSARTTSAFCKSVYGIIGGHNPDNLNTSLLASMLGHEPSGASTKVAVHFSQSLQTGMFRQFDYGDENILKYGVPEPPVYDLSKATVPVTIYYGGADVMIRPEDVSKLYDKLVHSSPKSKHKLDDYTHNDFTNGMDASRRLYQQIISTLDSS